MTKNSTSIILNYGSGSSLCPSFDTRKPERKRTDKQLHDTSIYCRGLVLTLSTHPLKNKTTIEATQHYFKLSLLEAPGISYFAVQATKTVCNRTLRQQQI
ncbi:hypothetical protein SAY86_016552 [Trapa natans]|uniref:Uncharacterized protein n=1 Tax=Trapa natans TaxID=22666 RepID=A0AAN7R000_TRANT|nr:hypothetical protein SAY86_016552 [Trapa natans]